MSTREQDIERLWEASEHGTWREDIAAAYDAGAAAERAKWAPVLAEVLKEAVGWLDEARGMTPEEQMDGGGWAARARALLGEETPPSEPEGDYTLECWMIVDRRGNHEVCPEGEPGAFPVFRRAP